jgi:hypothetical protein
MMSQDKQSANAIVLDDYRHWGNAHHGLTPGFG